MFDSVFEIVELFSRRLEHSFQISAEFAVFSSSGIEGRESGCETVVSPGWS